MGKFIFLLLIFLFFLHFFCLETFGAEVSSPCELLSAIKDSYESIESYSYTNYQGEYDTFNRQFQEEASSEYSDVSGNYGGGEENNISTGSEFKKGVYNVNFSKPFSVKMEIVSSDYTPSALDNAFFEYAPGVYPEIFTVTILGFGFIPIGSSRSIKDNTGDFLVMNWTVDLLEVEHLLSIGKPDFLRSESLDGKDTCVLEIDFPSPVNSSCPAYELGDIPQEIKFKIDYIMGFPAMAKISSVKYWIDKDELVIVKREQYIDGKLHSERLYKNISIKRI